MNSLPVRQVTDYLFVSPQLTPAAMAVAAAMGFRSVVNNRPDFEHGVDQPTNADIGAAAVNAGLEYRFLPVDGGNQTADEIASMAQLLNELPRPILAFCRSGSRSARLVLSAIG